MKYALLLAMIAAPAAAQTTVTVTETFQIDTTEQGDPSSQTPYGRFSMAGMPSLPEGARFVSGTFNGTLRWTQHGDFDPWTMAGTGFCSVLDPAECSSPSPATMDVAFWPVLEVSQDGLLVAVGGSGYDPAAQRDPCVDAGPYVWAPVDTTVSFNSLALVEPLDVIPFTVSHEEYHSDAPQVYDSTGNGYFDIGCGWTNLYYQEYRLTGVYTVTYELDKPAQTLVCGGNFPLQRQETVEAFMDGDDLLLVSEGENPNAFGFLFFNQGLGVFPGGGFVCVRGPALRSVPYQGDSAGRAVGRLEDLPLGTWYLQRVHRESAPGWGSASSGPAIEVVVQ
jgi:hypothetical protein